MYSIVIRLNSTDSIHPMRSIIFFNYSRITARSYRFLGIPTWNVPATVVNEHIGMAWYSLH